MGNVHETAEPPIDRLEDHVRSLYYDLRLSGQTPVAVVGSGLSIVYGGITWGESVRLALVEAKRLLANALGSAPDASKRNKIERASAGVAAMLANGALSESNDYYLAMDLCEEAFALVYDKGTGGVVKRPNQFRQFMRRLFENDNYVVADAIRLRLGIQGSTTELLDDLEKRRVCIQQVACHLYHVETLEELAKGDDGLTALHATIAAELGPSGVLPMDRRSLLCLFLAGKSQEERAELYTIVVSMLTPAAGATTEILLHPPVRPLIDPIAALYHQLGIRRFVTLNFDFELENSLMIDDLRATRPRPYGFVEAIDDEILEREVTIVDNRQLADSDTGGVTRRFTDGLAASSDIYSDKAVARLFEFALNSPDYRVQILHLHGRADKPETMLLTEKDLNRTYRRNRGARTMLEHGLDVVMTGNPIIFVGIGLTEQEITRALRQLVSEGRVTPTNPAFAIMAFDKGDADDKAAGGTESWRKQMSLFRQYGIRLIDAGHSRHDGKGYSLFWHLDVLGELTDQLKDSALLPKQGDAEKLRMACAELKLFDEMLLDKEGFLHISAAIFAHIEAHEDPAIPEAKRSAAWRRAKKANASKRKLWTDYLGKLNSKLRSVVLEREIERLDAGLREHAQKSSMTDATNAPTYKVRENAYARGTGTPVVRVRHQVDFGTATANPSQEVIDLARSIAALPAGNWSLLAPLGSAKGHIVRCLADLWTGPQRTPALIVNCNFALEFESAVYQILCFVWAHSALPNDDMPTINRIAALQKALENGVDPARMKGSSPPTIVISGIERLIDSEARPLAVELELVLALFAQTCAAKGWRIIIVGTPECAAYLRTHRLFAFMPVDPGQIDVNSGKQGLLPFLRKKASDGTSDKALKQRLKDTEFWPHLALMPNAARSDASRELLRLVLERWHDIAFKDSKETPERNRRCAEFGKAILGVMAFIGMPVETDILEHVPNLRQLAKGIRKKGERLRTVFKTAIDRLCKFGLVLRLKPFAKERGPRIVLHRIVLSEVRDRYGVRSGEEMLSNTFGLTLALSMPTDLAVADIDIHKQLKDVVGHLRGAWKDAKLPKATANAFARLRKAAGLFPNKDDISLRADNAALSERIARLERNICLAVTPMEATLRAAVGIVRSFFSAASLVAMTPLHHDRADGESGEFEEHKQRIGLLLARLREVQTTAAAMVLDVDYLKAALPTDPDLATAFDEIDKIAVRTSAEAKSPALYSGELVWLLNEHAVIALIQGDLYTAQKQFRAAESALRTFKGIGAGQSWRRIEINSALLLVERGQIGRARASLCQIGPKLNSEPRARHEDGLTAPLITGYLGLCDFLSGNYKLAQTHFAKAIDGLVDTDQQRALALFYWRQSELALNMDDHKGVEDNVRLSIGAAEAGRQMDVVWRARLTVTNLLSKTDPRLAETIYRESLAYAEHMELPRVSVMALSRHARHKLDSGDVDAAAMLATRAMTIAANCGMILSRISLRSLMGAIQLQQGDPSGEFLLRRAIAHADRIGYQLQVERAHKILLRYGSGNP